MDKELTKESAIEAVCRDGLFLEKLSVKYRDDKDVVLAAIRRDGEALEYASPKFRADRVMVLEAVKNAPNALRFASASLRNDVDIKYKIIESSDIPGKELLLSDMLRKKEATEMARHKSEENSYTTGEKIRMGAGLVLIVLALGAGPAAPMLAIAAFALWFWSAPKDIVNSFHEFVDEYGERREERRREREKEQSVLRENEKIRQEAMSEAMQRRRHEDIQDYQTLRKQIGAMPKYETWRQQVFAKCGRRCQKCGATKNLEIDHHPDSFYSIIKSEGITDIDGAYESRRLWDVDNGWVLCHDCHERTQSSQKYNELSSK